MIKVVLKTPLYKSFRRFGFPKMMPINYTIGVSNKCNSRCKTCYVWKKNVNEFTLEEFDKVFKKIGKGSYWFTLSGGEPFLRKDITELTKSVYDNCRPGIINIPTNGILHNIIPRKVVEIVDYCSESKIIVNVSIDDIGEKHDNIRGIKGNYELALKTFKELRKIDKKNFEL